MKGAVQIRFGRYSDKHYMLVGGFNFSYTFDQVRISVSMHRYLMLAAFQTTKQL